MLKTKVLIGKEKPNEWTATLLQISRQETKTGVGLITWHAEANYHKRKKEGVDSTVSSFCGVKKKTTRHILYDCKALPNMEDKKVTSNK